MKWAPPALALTALVEIVVFVVLGRAIGYGATILLIFAGSLAGLLVLRREGVRAWRRFRAAAESGTPPGRQVTDGLIGLGAGLLLAMPGVVTGVTGLLLLIPPLRAGARAGVQRATERRMPSMVAGDLFGPRRVRVRQGTPRADTPPPADAPPAAQSTAAPADPAAPVLEGEIIEPRR